jgi:uncharacterized protein (DUF433 family)
MHTNSVVVIDKGILGGIPVFAGTRVPVQTLVDYLKNNYSIEEFLDDFPTVSVEQTQAIIDLYQREFKMSATFREEDRPPR